MREAGFFRIAAEIAQRMAERTEHERLVILALALFRRILERPQPWDRLSPMPAPAPAGLRYRAGI